MQEFYDGFIDKSYDVIDNEYSFYGNSFLSSSIFTLLKWKSLI